MGEGGWEEGVGVGMGIGIFGGGICGGGRRRRGRGRGMVHDFVGFWRGGRRLEIEKCCLECGGERRRGVCGAERDY